MLILILSSLMEFSLTFRSMIHEKSTKKQKIEKKDKKKSIIEDEIKISMNIDENNPNYPKFYSNLN